MSETKKVLLAVLAHPDDETFGTGGTLALYASRGVEVHLICATRGEAGEVDEKYLRGFKTVGEKREAELRCAAEKLGIKKVHFLEYRDSGMEGSIDNQNPQALVMQPLGKVAQEVARLIRQLKPQVVITFDPIGGYRHPDHIFIHKATVEGFRLASDGKAYRDDLSPYQPARLFYNVIPRGFLKVAVRILRLIGKDPSKFGRNGDINLANIAAVSFPVHARINYREVIKIRDEASACHASQGGASMNTGLLGWWRRKFASQETYMQAYPENPPMHILNDLFEGIK